MKSTGWEKSDRKAKCAFEEEEGRDRSYRVTMLLGCKPVFLGAVVRLIAMH